MGWVTINGTKYYQVTKVIGHKLNDAGIEVPIKKVFRAHTKKECEELVRKSLASNYNDNNQTFGILADKWISSTFWKSNLSSRTKQVYYSAWEKYIKPLPLYTMKMKDVNHLVVQKAYNTILENGGTEGGLRSAHKLMVRFYKYCEKEGIARNFTDSLEHPKAAKHKKNEEITVWSDDEIRTILNGFDSSDNRFRIRFLLILAYYTGCRLGELLALTYDDFTEEGLKIDKQLQVIYKLESDGTRSSFLGIDKLKSAASNRTIPLNDIVLEELQIHKAWQMKDSLKHGYRTQYLFTTESGTFYDKRNLSRAAERYYKSIGIDSEGKGFHTFRHTFGTNLCRAKVPIQVASVLLGHEDISVTQKYYINVNKVDKMDAVKNLSAFTV